MEIGKLIRVLRKNQNMTLTVLSEESGVSHPYLSQIENGKFKPSPDILEKLAGPLETNFSSLLESAGYDDLAKGVKLREAQRIFQMSDDELRQIEEQERFIKGITDLKTFLERKVSPHPHYNGHKLTDQDRQRILDMLKTLFPEYQGGDLN